MCDFSADHRRFDVDDIQDIHKYLMKKNNVKKGLGLLKEYLLDY